MVVRTMQSVTFFSILLLLLVLLMNGAPTVGTRMLLIQGAANITTAEESPTEVHSKLPVVSIAVGVVSAVVMVFFLALTTMGFLQGRFQARKAAAAAAAAATDSSPAAREPQRFTLKELQSATVSFTQKVGKGAVFKGVLGDCTEVAVKLVENYTPSEFEEEVRRVASIEHENLVQILGFCNDSNHCLVVQEFLTHGSLRESLYSRSNISSNGTSMSGKGRVLSWSTRFGIALGTARALAHLHNNAGDGWNVHGRIKPENILLTDDWSPKVGDFGFSVGRGKRDHDLTLATAQGTLEYFAPEWWTDPSVQCDVYSFGILLLELVGGRRIVDFYDRSQWEFPDLECEDREGLTELLDPELKGKVDMAQLRTALQVAYWCIQFEPHSRPSMAQVVDFLEFLSQVSNPPTPSSSAIFTPLHLSYSASLEAFGFRAGERVEIVNAR